ncbi:mechanosensitive ion channel family protein [Paenibacillus sp. YYML68]|uniref:mechanosensitive ion channel family protein n=1 Tax=Paenibacillus sp. YYML68 TaxID=2909250 RepID=UPI00249324FB|nr:mechanosensitive ion channel family protein [Paenibacillus sp. YYML68]
MTILQASRKLQAAPNSVEGWTEAWMSMQEKLVQYVSDPEVWIGLLLIVVKITLIYVASRIIIKIANKAVQHLIVEREKSPLKFDARRTRTIGKLIGNIVSYVINFIMILMILSQFNINLGPLLAGAGVVGLAIGFGAQSLVKDVITGFFIIFEDQFAVGDVIQVDTYKGTVEEIGLRVTRIRSWTGEVFIIPNGSINQVTNFSINNSIAVVDVSVAYEADVEHALRILQDTVKEAYEVNPDIVKAPDVLGVQMLGASEIVLRVTAECKPNTHFAVGRKLNVEIKKAFDANKIEIPYPRLVTYHRKEQAEA